ncbi:MAG: flagellar biosynthesis anti-sigma factor FlgM [Sphingomonadaceae bacterium]
MDISGSNATSSGVIRDSQKLYDLVQRRVRGDSHRRSGSDEAVISDRGQLLQRLGEAVRDSTDVREEKVARLRAAIEQGRYHPSFEEIAKAILASRTR